LSHPVNDEHMEVLSAYINEIVRMRNNFADYVAKFELLDFLTREEVEFMNEISIACQKLSDTNTSRKLSNAEKEEMH
jgi:hypothetical protein